MPKYKVLKWYQGGRCITVCRPTDYQTAKVAFTEEAYKIAKRGIQTVSRQPERYVFEGITLQLCQHNPKQK